MADSGRHSVIHIEEAPRSSSEDPLGRSSGSEEPLTTGSLLTGTPPPKSRRAATTPREDEIPLLEYNGTLLAVEGEIKREDARARFQSQQLEPTRGLLKLDPAPFLFLMSESNYLEFAVADILQVTLGPSASTLAPSSASSSSSQAGGRGSHSSEDTSIDARTFFLTTTHDGQVFSLWLCAQTEEERDEWLSRLQRCLGDRHSKGPSGKVFSLRYEDLQVEGKVGEGKFGSVYKGQLWGTDVAVKMLQQVSVDTLEALMQEVDVLSKLRHPNIVLYIGACYQLPHVCLVTEWCTNGSLEALIMNPETQLDTQRLVKWATEIAQGLSYLHCEEPRTIHRDVKSANIFVDHNFTMKVGDFGLSHVGLTDVNEIAGTPMFMAPECWAGNSYDEKVDVWSFGMLLCEMINRGPPYPHLKIAVDIRDAVLGGQVPELPAWLPSCLRELIAQCLQRESARRPSFQNIITQLRSFFAGWDSFRFYQEVGHSRLLYLLNSSNERFQLWGTQEIAVIEAAAAASALTADVFAPSTARTISILNLPPASLHLFLARLTQLLESSNLLICSAVCRALGACFSRLSQHALDAEKEAKQEHARLQQCVKIVAVDNLGLQRLLKLLGREYNKTGLKDSRLLGLRRSSMMQFFGKTPAQEQLRVASSFEREISFLLPFLLGPQVSVSGLGQRQLRSLHAFIKAQLTLAEEHERGLRSQLLQHQRRVSDYQDLGLAINVQILALSKATTGRKRGSLVEKKPPRVMSLTPTRPKARSVAVPNSEKSPFR